MFQIEMARSYSVADWRDDIRRLVRNTGEKGIATTFLFGDHQIKVHLKIGYLKESCFLTGYVLLRRYKYAPEQWRHTKLV